MTNSKCIICDTRPAVDGGQCHNCKTRIDTDNRKRKREVFRYLTYRGHVVALIENNGTGVYRPELCKRDPEKLPRKITLNLNNYLHGFTRDQVKEFKKCVLQLARC